MKNDNPLIMISYRVPETLRNKLILAAHNEGRSFQEYMTRAAKASLQRTDNGVNEYDKSFSNADDLIAHLKD